MEIDREVLKDMIKAGALAAMREYDQDVIIPRENAMHTANSSALADLKREVAEIAKKVGTLWDAFQTFKGAWIILGLGATVLIIVVQHYWK